MTYLSGKAEQRRRIIRYSIYGVLFVLTIIFWGDIKKTTYPVIEPFVITYAKIKQTLSDIPTFFVTYTTTRETLIQKDKELMIAIERLENELQEKNAKLKEAGLVKEEEISQGGTTLVMYPLMQDVTRLYSTILLSRGFKDGIDVGEYVYVRGLQPVCIIQEVSSETALCQILSASGVTTDAVTEGTSSVSFTLTGRGGGTFLGNVARDTPIAVGDAVYLRSDPAMKIGTVIDVIHNDQDTSWHIFVRGMYNPVTSSIFYLHKK